MDLPDQRIACLRMAIEMGCKPDSVVGVATELMSFIASGGVASASPAAPEPDATAADRIAACGTVVPVSEVVGLALAEPEAVPAAAAPPHPQPRLCRSLRRPQRPRQPKQRPPRPSLRPPAWRRSMEPVTRQKPLPPLPKLPMQSQPKHRLPRQLLPMRPAQKQCLLIRPPSLQPLKLQPLWRPCLKPHNGGIACRDGACCSTPRRSSTCRRRSRT